MQTIRFHPVLALAALACVPVAALAHAGHGDIAALPDGIVHVTMGVDHMLAAFAVGVWAMAYPWRRSWMLRVAFVAAMAAGAVGIGRSPFHATEPTIVAGR